MTPKTGGAVLAIEPTRQTDQTRISPSTILRFRKSKQSRNLQIAILFKRIFLVFVFCRSHFRTSLPTPAGERRPRVRATCRLSCTRQPQESGVNWGSRVLRFPAVIPTAPPIQPGIILEEQPTDRTARSVSGQVPASPVSTECNPTAPTETPRGLARRLVAHYAYPARHHP